VDVWAVRPGGRGARDLSPRTRTLGRRDLARPGRESGGRGPRQRRRRYPGDGAHGRAVDDRQARRIRRHAARLPTGHDVPGELRPRTGLRARGRTNADRCAIAGLGAHDTREPADLGDETGPRGQGIGLDPRLRLHRPNRGRVDGRGGASRHPGVRGAQQADAGGGRRLPGVLLPRRPRGGDGAAAGGARSAGT
jgi:hypothetical protein